MKRLIILMLAFTMLFTSCSSGTDKEMNNVCACYETAFIEMTERLGERSNEEIKADNKAAKQDLQACQQIKKEFLAKLKGNRNYIKCWRQIMKCERKARNKYTKAWRKSIDK